MRFVPSRDLPSLSTKSSTDSISNKVRKVRTGLCEIEKAFGLEVEEQHVWIGRDTRDVSDEESLASKDDEFELSHTQRWLSNVACLKWLSLEEQTSIGEDVDEILDKAAKLVATCAGKSASGKATRVYHFCCEAREDIKVKVQDQAVTQDSLGSRTWGAAPLLASSLLQEHLPRMMPSLKRLRVLELGAGTGLVGLTTSRYLNDRCGSTETFTADIVLTDFNDDVLANLQRNVYLNAQEGDKVAVHVCSLDWTDPQSSTLDTTKFDLIIAADCVYEPEHASLLKDMAERYLSVEGPVDDGIQMLSSKFIMMCPIRPTHQQDLERISQAFPVQATSPPSTSTPPRLALCITHQQDLYGYDNFGPPLLHSQSDSALSNDGQRVPYREFISQWCRI